MTLVYMFEYTFLSLKQKSIQQDFFCTAQKTDSITANGMMGGATKDFLLYREIKTVLCDLSQQGTEIALKIEHL